MASLSFSHSHYLCVWDYLVLAVLLAASLVIGLYFGCTGGKQKTTKEYFVADGNMGTLPTALSLLGSSVNAIMILGTTTEIYYHDTTFWYLALSYCITIPVAVYFYIPVYFELEVISAYEYLEKRFNKATRIIGSICFMVQTITFTALVLYTPSLALSQVTGLDLWTSIISLGIICTFYTTMGGIKAVMWSDALQISLMFGCLVAIAILGCINVGGFQYVWEKGLENRRIRFTEFNPNPFIRHSFWSLAIGGCFPWISSYCTNQAFVQRYIATPSIRKAQKALWWNLPCLMLFITVSCFGGLVVYAYYWDCDPLLTRRIEKPDQLMPLFVMDVFSHIPGFAGLFIAGCFCGALSTISSSINSLSAVSLVDFIKPYCWNKMSDNYEVILSKALTMAYGALCVLIVAIIQNLDNIITMGYTLGGLLGGPIVGLFTLGMFFPRANALGAIFGVVGSFVFTSWIAFGSLKNKMSSTINSISTTGCDWFLNSTVHNNTSALFVNHTSTTDVKSIEDISLEEPHNFDDIFLLYKLSYMWYGAISCFIVIIIGVTLSYFTGTNSSKIDDSLLSPVPRRIMRLLNKKFFKKEYIAVKLVKIVDT